MVTLALEIRKHPALRFAGLQAYHGGAQHLRSVDERRQALTDAAARLNAARDALTAAAAMAHERLGFEATWHLTLAPHYVAGLMVLVRGARGAGVAYASSDLHDRAAGPGRNAVSIVATQRHRALADAAVTARLAESGHSVPSSAAF